MLKSLSLSALKTLKDFKLRPLSKTDKVLCAMFFLLLIGICIPFNRINVTISESMRTRIYWLSQDKNVKKGDVVMFSDANIATKFKHEKLTKLLACDEGDLLEVNNFKEFYCNKQYIGRGKDFSIKGARMEHFVFNGVIPAGKMFVLGQHKDSYDSRYRGFINKSAIITRLVPLF